MLRKINRILVVLLFSGIGILVPFNEAHACLFDVPLLGQGPSPFPPCEARSVPSHEQLRSKMVRLGGKMVDLALEIQNTKAEVRAWQQTIESAKQVEQELRNIHGDLTVNPMRSLISSYERSTTLVMVREAQGVRERIVNTSLGDLVGYVERDLRAHADSLLGVWRSPDSLSKLFWGSAMAAAAARRDEEFYGLGLKYESQLASLEQFRRDSRVSTDSLLAVGNRFGSRYEGQSNAGGMAEAKISSFSASLAKLRGTAYGARAQSIQQKLGVLDGIEQTRRLMEAERQTRASVGRGF